MRSALAFTFFLLTQGASWAACNPATRQSFDAFMDCVDNETQTRDAYDRRQQEIDRRLDAIERNQRFRESCPDCR